MCVVILNTNRATCSVGISQAKFVVGVYGGMNCTAKLRVDSLAFVGTLKL